MIRREGEWAVRVFGPASGARRAFAGVEATPYDPAFAPRGRFRPYSEGRRVQVENADGRVRGLGLGLGGELTFPSQGAEHTLQVAVDEDDGSLRAVFGDATGGRSTHRFCFLEPGIPDAGGAITVDSTGRCFPPEPSRTTSSVRFRHPGTRCPSKWRRASGG